MLPLTSHAAAAVLATGLQDLGVEIAFDDLGDAAARLHTRDGQHQLILDVSSDATELCRCMAEALTAVAFGAHTALTARHARPPLHLVS